MILSFKNLMLWLLLLEDAASAQRQQANRKSRMTQSIHQDANGKKIGGGGGGKMIMGGGGDDGNVSGKMGMSSSGKKDSPSSGKKESIMPTPAVNPDPMPPSTCPKCVKNCDGCQDCPNCVENCEMCNSCLKCEKNCTNCLGCGSYNFITERLDACLGCKCTEDCGPCCTRAPSCTKKCGVDTGTASGLDSGYVYCDICASGGGWSFQRDFVLQEGTCDDIFSEAGSTFTEQISTASGITITLDVNNDEGCVLSVVDDNKEGDDMIIYSEKYTKDECKSFIDECALSVCVEGTIPRGSARLLPPGAPCGTNKECCTNPPCVSYPIED